MMYYSRQGWWCFGSYLQALGSMVDFSIRGVENAGDDGLLCSR